MIRLWNCLIKMAEDRINKKVFIWSKLHSSPWAKELYSIFEEVDMLCIYRNNLCCNVNLIKNKPLLKFVWKYFVKTKIKNLYICISKRILALKYY